jgi:two-component system, chemotaxis family, CheB/CheR fusion protein
MPSQQDIRTKNGEAVTAEIDLPYASDLASAHQFPIVGIGASAGGLDAFKALLAKLPPDTGMAFVLIQHLDPLHVSLMGGLLASHTAMPVKQAAEGALIEPNKVYLIPPAVSLSVSCGKLHLSEPAERQGSRTAFDFFLRSLAEDCGGNAVCVVLSGTGSDGSEGLKAVRANGGFVIVQKPSEAAFDGMPKSAIQTGQTDLVLPVAEIPAALINHKKRIQPLHSQPDKNEGAHDRFLEILDLVRTRTRHDLSPYKTGTLTRRIERRMTMAGMTDAARYIDKLSADASELDSLGRDLLINVTQFFRDADSFDALARGVIPEMVAAQPPERPLRIWVPGCSTGEEAYSLAIVFFEAIAASNPGVKLQVFASDVDAHSIAFARAGLYAGETASQVSPGRLEQFFTQQSTGFRVVRDLREAVVFTVQDLLADAPFSRLDLISCRNVLIYLQPGAQEQILSLFHFALRAGGILFLGRSETVGKYTERFQPINKKQRIYRHQSAGRPGEAVFNSGGAVRERLAPVIGPPLRRMPAQVNLEDVTSKHLLEYRECVEREHCENYGSDTGRYGALRSTLQSH